MNKFGPTRPSKLDNLKLKNYIEYKIIYIIDIYYNPGCKRLASSAGTFQVPDFERLTLLLF